MSTDKLPEPVAWVDPRQLARGCASLHCVTKPEYRSWGDARAGVEYMPVYTADQLHAALAAQAEAHADQLAIYDASMDALRAEVEALRADAERYRWLCDKAPATFWADTCWLDTTEADAAIDAARRQS